MDLLNNLVLMGEAIVEFGKNIAIYGSGVGGLVILAGGFKFLRKL